MKDGAVKPTSAGLQHLEGLGSVRGYRCPSRACAGAVPWFARLSLFCRESEDFPIRYGRERQLRKAFFGFFLPLRRIILMIFLDWRRLFW